MLKDLAILGLNVDGECIYSIDLPLIAEYDIPALIHTCRQHAQFQGAVEVQMGGAVDNTFDATSTNQGPEGAFFMRTTPVTDRNTQKESD